MTFEVEARDPACGARAGLLRLAHGEVRTPIFMPVGTQASVKTMDQGELASIGTQILLANAYHLYLRPGTELFETVGGIHQFMTWDRPVLTDSGGFQVFSLAQMNKVTREGVEFRSHLDGSRHFFTPARAIDVQIAIGADIIMCFDECTSYPVSEEQAAESMRMTVDWAGQCRAHWASRAPAGQALFGIVQGSVYPELRRECAEALVALDFPGYAIGGVSVGESKAEMVAAIEATAPHLPEDKPRYLMGVGPPEDLLEAVERGVDMFDCIMPTRDARNGSLFTSQGKLNIKAGRYLRDFGPPDPNCGCPVCRRYSRAYLSHLYRSGEILALRLNTLHNLSFMLSLAAAARDAVIQGRFIQFKRTFLQSYMSGQ